MSEKVSRSGRRRIRWSLGALMIGVAALSAVFALIRPLATPSHLRAAEKVLRTYGPPGTPGLSPDNYRVENVTQAPRGWLIHYVRVSGTGLAETDVFVANQVVQGFRFNPWASLETAESDKLQPPSVAPPSRVPVAPNGS